MIVNIKSKGKLFFETSHCLSVKVFTISHFQEACRMCTSIKIINQLFPKVWSFLTCASPVTWLLNDLIWRKWGKQTLFTIASFQDAGEMKNSCREALPFTYTGLLSHKRCLLVWLFMEIFLKYLLYHIWWQKISGEERCHKILLLNKKCRCR